jgi:starch synthase (maltosyl-transferring)
MSQAANITLFRTEQRARRDAQPAPLASLHRVYMLDTLRSRQSPPPELLSWITQAGFDTLLLSLPRQVGTADVITPPPIVEAAAQAGLRIHLDLALDVARETAPVVRRHPDWYRAVARRGADPRNPPAPLGLHVLSLQGSPAIEAFVEYWAALLRQLGESGISGLRCKPHEAVPPIVWQRLTAAAPDFDFSVWTPGLPATEISRLPRGCFKLSFNSLAWWDFGAGWLSEEAARLELVAPAANTVTLPAAPASAAAIRSAAHRLLEVAASNGNGILSPMGFEFGLPVDLSHPAHGADDWQRLRDYALLDFTAALRAANARLAARVAPHAAPTILSSEDAPVAVLFEAPAQLTLANRYLDRSAAFDPASVLPMLDGGLDRFALAGRDADPVRLAPGEVRVLTGTPAQPIVMAAAHDDPVAARRAVAAAGVSRVCVEAIEPAVDNGRFAVKRVAGERVTVAADIFADGHGKIAAALQWRAKDANDWREIAMLPTGNDRWSASFLLERVGAYLFRVVAWPDRFATWLDEVTKKHAAGIDVSLELEEGKLLLETIAELAPGGLDDLIAALDAADAAERLRLLTASETTAVVARADTRPGRTVGAELPIDADRRAAEFASWYELFPRNQSGDAGRHGTFRDVIQKLPAIRDMGFDVLYFPPIHPIGRANRKGPDNTILPAGTAEESASVNPGSPYAIGAPEGGHDAIHPALGTLDDFHALRDAAAEHGLELALDFAIQCSPDHPWVTEHPEWFDWRPDGGLRYAENPPKKYEDIVNVDFHRAGAIPGLWLALRDVVAYWADQGVRAFRVDNPHTKPFAFWEWLIADIRGRWPDALFLAEAFTRPKIMYRLAKLGFTQSYTYFTWRNEKWEIEAYLRELTATPSVRAATEATGGPPKPLNVVDFFRPNFFVNTPDINPLFLQQAGRAGFLIRAALAATLSGLWGMLQGFEFCEAEPLRGREEYAHSDKYEIRVRPDRSPGDIVDEIARLNALRRANPALQSHRGLAFHQAANDRVLWYRKANVDRSNVVLVAVSLDPFATQTATVEVPLWEWGLSDDAALTVTDLMRGGNDVWAGKHRTISLDPRTLPFGIWRARPREFAR